MTPRESRAFFTASRALIDEIRRLENEASRLGYWRAFRALNKAKNEAGEEYERYIAGDHPLSKKVPA